MLIWNLNKKIDFVIISNAILIVHIAAELAPLSVGDFVLIAEFTTETLAVARTGGERHTPPSGVTIILLFRAKKIFIMLENLVTNLFLIMKLK